MLICCHLSLVPGPRGENSHHFSNKDLSQTTELPAGIGCLGSKCSATRCKKIGWLLTWRWAVRVIPVKLTPTSVFSSFPGFPEEEILPFLQCRLEQYSILSFFYASAPPLPSLFEALYSTRRGDQSAAAPKHPCLWLLCKEHDGNATQAPFYRMAGIWPPCYTPSSPSSWLQLYIDWGWRNLCRCP